MIDKILGWLTRESSWQKPEAAILRLALEAIEKAMLGLVFGALLTASPYFVNSWLSSLHGPWVDQAFSEVLSKHYGQPVTVRDVRIAQWSDIYFSSLKINSLRGEPWVSSSYGSLRLKDFKLFGAQLFETEICLHQAMFYREYYKNSATFKPWNQILHKPICVEELTLKVMQSDKRTLLKILECHSQDVILEGALLINQTGKVHDAIRITFSPWMIMRALV